jgi:hypothetical protein
MRGAIAPSFLRCMLSGISGPAVILFDGSTYILPRAKKDSVVAQYTDYVTDHGTR